MPSHVEVEQLLAIAAFLADRSMLCRNIVRRCLTAVAPSNAAATTAWYARELPKGWQLVMPGMLSDGPTAAASSPVSPTDTVEDVAPHPNDVDATHGNLTKKIEDRKKNLSARVIKDDTSVLGGLDVNVNGMDMNDVKIVPSAPSAAMAKMQAAASIKHQELHHPYSATGALAASPVPRDILDRIQVFARDERVRKMGRSTELTEGAAVGNDFNAEPEEEQPQFAIKCFNIGEFAHVYSWLGKAAALAEELDTFPLLDWFYSEVTVTMPLSPRGLLIAKYMNEQELLFGTKKNFSSGTDIFEEGSQLLDDEAMCDKLASRSRHSFCWILNGQERMSSDFNSEIYLQWYHRADFLVKRRSREKKEFRLNMTLEQILKSSSQQRRRRVEKREDRDKLRKDAQSMEAPPTFNAARWRRSAASKRQKTDSDGKQRMVPLDGNVMSGSDDMAEFAAARDDASGLNRMAHVISETPGNVETDATTAAAHGSGRKPMQRGGKAGPAKAPTRAEELADERERLQGYVPDMLPREVRERLDADAGHEDGMDDFRRAHGGGLMHTNRST
jgi:hypothetical protein